MFFLLKEKKFIFFVKTWYYYLTAASLPDVRNDGRNGSVDDTVLSKITTKRSFTVLWHLWKPPSLRLYLGSNVGFYSKETETTNSGPEKQNRETKRGDACLSHVILSSAKVIMRWNAADDFYGLSPSNWSD